MTRLKQALPILTLLAALTTLSLSAAASPSSIWTAKNFWSMEWEQRYTAFVQSELSPSFLKELEIPSDCADLPVIVRAIFSRINELPFALEQGPAHTQSSALPTTTWNPTTWKNNLREDPRFKAFLKTISQNTNTSNLGKSLYPIQISDSINGSASLASSVRPGLVALTEHHARVIWKITPNQWRSIWELSSTVPYAVRTLQINDLSIDDYPASPREGGLLAFRWPEACGSKWCLRAPDKMPGYSMEQYRIPKPDAPLERWLEDSFRDTGALFQVGTFSDTLQALARIAGYGDPTEKDFSVILDEIFASLTLRQDTLKKCDALLTSGRIGNRAAFEFNCSTENRDGELARKLRRLMDLGHFAGRMGEMETRLGQHVIPIDEHRKTDAYQFFLAKSEHEISAVPYDSALKRWGWAFLMKRAQGMLALSQESPEQAQALASEIKTLRDYGQIGTP